MNRSGHRETLQARQPGNVNGVRHGAFSRRTLAPRAREVADALLEAPHVVGLDRIAAEEIGAVVAMLEAIDEDLLTRGLTKRDGSARSLLELRIRLSGRLGRWLREFGATPASRLHWVEQLSRGETLAEAVRNEVVEGIRLVSRPKSGATCNSDKDKASHERHRHREHAGAGTSCLLRARRRTALG
jgi:hypothetical protein